MGGGGTNDHVAAAARLAIVRAWTGAESEGSV